MNDQRQGQQALQDDRQDASIGPYRLTRELRPGRHAPRWLALNDTLQTSHVLHEFAPPNAGSRLRLVEALGAVGDLRHPHIVIIEGLEETPRALWVVTPYTGHQDGLVSLETLLSEKGGAMPPLEAERAITQVLQAVSYAHETGHQHGPLGLDEALVDRRGSIAIEFYGLRRRLALPGRTAGAFSELVRDETRSIVEMGYRLLTGLSAEEPRIRAGRLIKRLDRRWDDWFDVGLDAAGGFATAAEALSALPSMVREIEARPAAGPVQIVLDHVRRVLRP